MAAVFVVASLVLCDLVQRTAVAALAHLLPRRRSRILTAWIQAMRAIVLDIAIGVIAGGDLGPTPKIPARAGVLVIMNHQSLLDIPLVVKSVEAGYPRIVTRRRYGRGIPVISHITRLYQYPVVDPQATGKGDLQGLREAASNGEMPIAIFPEGTRSKTGELGPWKRAGLRLLLKSRSWEVYVIAVDGVWQARRFVDFVRTVSGIRCRVGALGPFPSPSPGEDIEPFIDEMRARMAETLDGIRATDSR
jgi:1-acyl-sn-glycerol-3-phosphate acyltransferase